MQFIWWPGNTNWVTLLLIDQLVVIKSFYSVYSVHIYDVDSLIHSDPVSTLEPYTSPRFIVILSPIYPHISRVVDYDDSFRLKLLGTACTWSAYPTHFNYKSFLQVLYCVIISHTCWTPRSCFSTLLFTLTQYIYFLCAVYDFLLLFYNFPEIWITAQCMKSPTNRVLWWKLALL